MDLLIVLAGKYLYLIVILIAAGWVFLKAKNQIKDIAKLILVSFPAAYIAAKVIGHFYYNQRPFVVGNVKPIIDHAADNGFPSDHTLLAMTVSAVIFSYNKKLGIFLAILTLATGYARVAAGIHHQIDVLAAAAVAIVAVYMAAKILNQFAKHGR